MSAPRPTPALTQFVEDELLRAPLLFDQIMQGLGEQVQRHLPMMSSFQRSAAGEMLQTAQVQRTRLSARFVDSVREQVQLELNKAAQAGSMPPAPRPVVLALVEEDAVALDVELSHIVQMIKSGAEIELRELRTYIATLVGDLDLAEDHNPFRPEVLARALWAAAQALPLSRGHQVAFMRYAGTPLAQVLRQAYAAACTRLEAAGVEPARYRTLVMPDGTRKRRTGTETTFSPDLHRVLETLPVPHEPRTDASHDGGKPLPAPAQEVWREIARSHTSAADRQSVELVSRLFQEILADDRLPSDVSSLLGRLHGPAMRLALRDPSVLDKNTHPLWRFLNVFAYSAEMAPDGTDPERVRMLRLGQHLIDQMSAQTEQRASIYSGALQKLDEFLRQRLDRRCAQVASQIGALQKLEAKAAAEQSTVPGSLEGVLDLQVMDTVPGELMPTSTGEPVSSPTDVHQAAVDWLGTLQAGFWVRMLIQGRWVRAQLLWTGERRSIFLFGDGASDATWAVRRKALLMMHAGKLAKTLKVRSLVGSAAARVQEKLAGAAAGSASGAAARSAAG